MIGDSVKRKATKMHLLSESRVRTRSWFHLATLSRHIVLLWHQIILMASSPPRKTFSTRLQASQSTRRFHSPQVTLNQHGIHQLKTNSRSNLCSLVFPSNMRLEPFRVHSTGARVSPLTKFLSLVCVSHGGREDFIVVSLSPLLGRSNSNSIHSECHCNVC